MTTLMISDSHLNPLQLRNRPGKRITFRTPFRTDLFLSLLADSLNSNLNPSANSLKLHKH